ncbi:hypothetical protein BC827DRAFT_764968 [Russula dissimulans]|nr:hypothetical protein BC827DRAFT_764968 [Russula dissimulans]
MFQRGTRCLWEMRGSFCLAQFSDFSFQCALVLGTADTMERSMFAEELGMLAKWSGFEPVTRAWDGPNSTSDMFPQRVVRWPRSLCDGCLGRKVIFASLCLFIWLGCDTIVLFGISGVIHVLCWDGDHISVLRAAFSRRVAPEQRPYYTSDPIAGATFPRVNMSVSIDRRHSVRFCHDITEPDVLTRSRPSALLNSKLVSNLGRIWEVYVEHGG